VTMEALRKLIKKKTQNKKIPLGLNSQ